MRTLTATFCLIVLLAAGCHQVTAEDKAAQDARDVAMVKAAQNIHPPVQPLTPQPISPEVRRVYRLTDAGCDFRPDARRNGEPVLVAGHVRAVLRVDDQALVLVADSGSAKLPSGVYGKYVGREHWAQLTSDPATLTIRDRWERVVYSSGGALACRG